MSERDKSYPKPHGQNPSIRKLIHHLKRSNQLVRKIYTHDQYQYAIWHLLPVAVSRIFLKVFLKKYKLYNLIKREIHILTTTTIKKNANTLSLQLASTSFYILKSVHDSVIINDTSYISFNVYN